MLGRSPFAIFVAGSSKIKINATQAAVNQLDLYATVNGIHIPGSGVSEQPVGDGEILRGATNRAALAYQANPRGQVYLGIENGIVQVEGEEWVDYAIAYMMQPLINKATWLRSRPVVFPSDAVEATRLKPGGFAENTVGKTLTEMGVVKRHDDPHSDLTGVSRLDTLTDLIVQVLAQVQ